MGKWSLTVRFDAADPRSRPIVRRYFVSDDSRMGASLKMANYLRATQEDRRARGFASASVMLVEPA